MADKSTPLILTALGRAAATGTLPLYAARTAPGLFPTTAAGKQAAQRCHEEGYLTEVPTEAPPETTATTAVKKKTAIPLCTITDKGMTYLLSQVSPRQVLEEVVHGLQSRQEQLTELCNEARRAAAAVETLKANVEKVLDQLPRPGAATSNGQLKSLFTAFLHDGKPQAPTGDVETTLIDELARWQKSGASEDCPLPHLYRHLQARHTGLTVGCFHDVLRRLHDSGKLYLHPWTGPLYDLPEPSYALLAGHGVAYYASLK